VSGAPDELLAWATTASMCGFALVLVFRGGRRRSAINEAVHELRRPLQALALAPAQGGGARESSVRLAARALERLDRVVNGGERQIDREQVRCDELLRSAVLRWQLPAAIEGSELALSWGAGPASVEGDPSELGQALDNLIVNAIEHGGSSILVEGACGRDRLRLCVADSGQRSRRPLRGDAFSLAVERFSGRRRRGHGLAIVRRTAAAHGGRFVLERSAAGSRAVLELPLLERVLPESAG
jgi:two-component system OmpR family sensor kinase